MLLRVQGAGKPETPGPVQHVHAHDQWRTEEDRFTYHHCKTRAGALRRGHVFSGPLTGPGTACTTVWQAPAAEPHELVPPPDTLNLTNSTCERAWRYDRWMVRYLNSVKLWSDHSQTLVKPRSYTKLVNHPHTHIHTQRLGYKLWPKCAPSHAAQNRPRKGTTPAPSRRSTWHPKPITAPQAPTRANRRRQRRARAARPSAVCSAASCAAAALARGGSRSQHRASSCCLGAPGAAPRSSRV